MLAPLFQTLCWESRQDMNIIFLPFSSWWAEIYWKLQISVGLTSHLMTLSPDLDVGPTKKCNFQYISRIIGVTIAFR